MDKTTNVASPEATGNAGAYFEQHVDAAFLAILLVGGMPPFLRDCRLQEIHLQAGHRGWRTDDVLLVGCNASGIQRNAAVQVKRRFSISASDEDCVSTFIKAWQDFRNPSIFTLGRDMLAIVAGEASSQFLKGFRTLLDCARAAINISDFENRLSIDGYLSKKVREFAKVIRDIVEEANGSTLTGDDFLHFLRAFDFVCLDLNTPGSYTEALIRNLLALSATNDNGAELANITWNELLQLVSLESGAARSFRRDELPQALLVRHRQSSGADTQTLEALSEMTTVVARGVNICIGDHHLTRAELELKLLELLEEHRVVLVTGESGIGKSGIALGSFKVACANALGLALRAEMLATAHINETLFKHGLTLKRLKTVTALHPRKIIWMESAERLLEKPEREAFRDFLHVLVDDPSWKLIITCRDYSAETFRSAFLDDTSLSCAVLRVPLLKEAELVEVKGHYPVLARPLSSSHLHSLLRNPFLLNKAARMNWQPDTPLPQDERAFRAKVWREVIRKEDEAEDGMPQLRGEAFITLALCRARALQPFVSCHDLHPAAVQRLKRDTLVMAKPDDDDLLAPAHDVLEDWALLQWLSREFEQCDHDWSAFFERIGTYPALRRAFRKWLTEMLCCAPQEADRHVLSIICNLAIPAHWRDDALVAALLAPDADEFLRRNRGILLKDGAALLRRVLHLVRIACKQTPDYLCDVPNIGVQILIPAGSAWEGVAELLDLAVSQFKDSDFLLQLQFLEDWCYGITLRQPYPPGAEHIGRVALRLLPLSHPQNLTERVLKVLLRIPKTVELELRRMVEDCIADERNGWEDPTLLKLLFNHFDGSAVCRDLPDIILKVAVHVLGIEQQQNEEELDTWWQYNRMRHVEDAFGLPRTLHFDGFPPSAYHGPFFNLLYYHPAQALELVLNFVNQACTVYANPENAVEFVEPPVEVDFELPDGTRKRLWGGWRLWGLYRSATIAPHVLQNALMALEVWLLQKAENDDADLPDVLAQLIERSNNVAITAVVTSVAMAFPHRAGPAAVSLLTCRAFFEWEFARLTSEQRNPDNVLAGMMPPRDLQHSFYEMERKESAKKPHRQHDLEYLAVMLQHTQLRKNVWEVFDRFRVQLPPEHEQGDEDRLWRLKLHRMDVRNFQVVGRTDDGKMLVQSSAPPSDVQQMIELQQPYLDEHQVRVGLLTWAMSIFQHRNDSSIASEDWRLKLAIARQVAPPQGNERLPARLHDSALAYVAAVCIRDHWEEITNDEKTWCVEKVCDTVERDADCEDHIVIVGRNLMDGSRPAAFVLPSLFGKSLPEHLHQRLLPTLAKGVQHAVNEVVHSTALGIGNYLWPTNRTLVLTCVHTLLTWARLKQQFYEDQHKRPYGERLPEEKFERELRANLREKIEQGAICDTTMLTTMLLSIDYRDWPWQSVLPPLLSIFGQLHDALSVRFFSHLAVLIPKSWRAEKNHRSVRREQNRDIAHFGWEIEYAVEQKLADFALTLDTAIGSTLCAPIVATIEQFPEDISKFLKLLIVAEDRLHTGEKFWMLWQQFADAFLASKLPGALDQKYSDATKLLDVLFLNSIEWKPETHDWQPLHGQAHRLLDLFQRLPATRDAISAFVYFLQKIGGILLPGPLTLISEKLKSGAPTALLSPNAIYWTEGILARLIYGGMVRIRTEAPLRNATMHILDSLIECGSSAAYKLRDDFLTPLRS